MTKALVTVCTDGFRDYVELPDGRTLNLGSTSVLKLVTTLVGPAKLCRRALDTFLESGSAVIKVDIDRLQDILKPKRSRWAGKDLMPEVTREQGSRMSTGQTKEADAELVDAKFSSLVRAFNALYTQPSESTIGSFKEASADFLAFTTGKVAGVDEVAKHELEEFLENDNRALKLKEDVLESILSKPKYDHNFARRLWLNWVDKGAESYSNKFDESDNALFPRALREALARDIADRERVLIDDGAYAHLKTATGEDSMSNKTADSWEDMKEPAEVSGTSEEVAKQMGVSTPNVPQDENNNKVGGLKLAAEEVPFVNEGLIHLVVAKVESALKLVEASQKKGAEVAKGDLHIISTKLDGLTKTASMEDPNLRSALLDLAKKADFVRSFFE